MILNFSVGGKVFRSEKIAATVANFNGNMRNGILASCILVEGKIKRDYLSGQVLNVRTNRLRGSITHKMPQLTTGGWQGTVGTNVIYAPVHEYGATIEAKNKPYLRFQTADGSWHSVRKVVIPPRPFMGPALEDNRDEIVQTMKRHITRHL